MAPNAEGLVGQVIGGYRLERLISVGGMGAVFQASRIATVPDEPPSAQVAVKVLVPPWQATAEERASFQARFRREAEVLQRLRHPHILSILDAGEDAGFTYMVLPYMSGGTLATQLVAQRGPIPFEEAASYIEQVASALDYAHTQGVVHRDIKPANILLDGQGNAYLADFSIVRLFDITRTTLTAAGQVIGTPEYMAPEQFGGSDVGAAADIYSLGVVLDQLITGQVPFQGSTFVELLRKHLQDPVPPPRTLRPELPEPAEAVILRALAKRPADRFVSAGKLAEAFRLGLQGHWTVGAPPAEMPQGGTGAFALPPTLAGNVSPTLAASAPPPTLAASPLPPTSGSGFQFLNQGMPPTTPAGWPAQPAAQPYGAPGAPVSGPYLGHAAGPVTPMGSMGPVGAYPGVGVPTGRKRPGLAVSVTLAGLAAVLILAVLFGLGVFKGNPGIGGTGNTGGAGTAGAGATASGPQVLHITWPAGGGTADVTTLDPNTASDTSAIPIVNQVFDGLVVLNKDLQIQNWGADKITVSSDGRTYVFHLRDGQKFSDGTPVLASDYAFAMDRSENPCVASPVNYYLWNIVDAQTFSSEICDTKTGTISPYSGQTGPVIKTLIGDSIIPDDAAGTLTVKLTAPAGYFLDAMTYSTSYALEKSIVTGVGLGANEQWLNNLTKGPTGQGGSGMFYVSTWDHHGTLILKANPNWWGRSAGMTPRLTEVDYTIFSSADTEYAAYDSSKTYEVNSDIPGTELASAKAQSDFHNGPYLGVEGLDMNFNIPPFNNLDARAAFCLALNRDQINTNILKGADQPSWHLVPQGMPGYYAGLQALDSAPTTGNQTLAVQEWQKYTATLNGAPVPTIQYSYNTASQSSTDYANALITTWKQVLGVNVQTNPKQWRQILQDEFAKKVQMFRFGWVADYPDPQDFLSLLYATSSSYNENNSGSPQLDSLMSQADQSQDQSTRMSLYNQIEQGLVNNVSNCPLFQLALNYRVRSYAHGYLLDAQGVIATPDWHNVFLSAH